MGNVLQCGSQDDQLKAAEAALENVKDEAASYKQRIAELEAQMYKVRVAQLEKALKKERDAKPPTGSGVGPVAGAGAVLLSQAPSSSSASSSSSSSSSYRPLLEQQRSDFEAYTKSEGGAVFRSIMQEAADNKPPSFGNIYGMDNPEDQKPVTGYNPLYRIEGSTGSGGIAAGPPGAPSTALLNAMLVGSMPQPPPTAGAPAVDREKARQEEDWQRLAIAKARLDEEDAEQRAAAAAAARPMTLAPQDSLAGLALPPAARRPGYGHDVVESAGV